MTDTINTQTRAQTVHAAADRFDRMIRALNGIRQVMDLLKERAEYQKRPAVPERLESMRGSTALLGDVTTWADGMTAGITGVIDHALLSDEADFLWDVSADILNRHASRNDPDNMPYQRLSSVLLLEALIASPAAVQNALELLRALLLDEDPEVVRLRAALEGKTTAA